MADDPKEGDPKEGDPKPKPKAGGEPPVGPTLTDEIVSEWLRTEKGIENVDSLHTALKGERSARKKAERALKDFDGVDVERYRELVEAEDERHAAKLKDEDRWEDMKARLKEQHDKDVAKLAAEIERRDRLVEKLTVDNELTAALDKAGILPEHRKAVRALLKEVAPPAVEWDGDDARGQMGNVPIAEYVDSWAKSDEAALYIQGSGAGGSGTPPHGGGEGAFSADKPAAEMTEDEKRAWREKHGYDAWVEKLQRERTPTKVY